MGNPKPTEREAREVEDLFRTFLRSWNARDAQALANLVAEDGYVIGFDRSHMNGPAEVASAMGEVFAHHQTAAYVGLIRQVRVLSPDLALLRAAVGMVPPGHAEINPAVNAFQSLVAARQSGRWQILLLETTPAQFHARPDLSSAFTEELREALRKSGLD